MQDFDLAKADLLAAHELAPNDRAVKDAFRLFKQKKQDY